MLVVSGSTRLSKGYYCCLRSTRDGHGTVVAAGCTLGATAVAGNHKLVGVNNKMADCCTLD